ncbi:BNR repeat-containing protein [Streptomonospora wellingtoniae]|uniref:BNR repeat-containing protein n=1 Tax=Streptomonospora wellingtoniae TaxID=3075544 RepID=A0ABU2KW90_9ACTN|nr:BNR repeat-containing protein [Streptomonospora sp. DSM 45055]MDT0303571.1 BNR repeat-containing protein [Streptomonospora sp. DSM 45055]
MASAGSAPRTAPARLRLAAAGLAALTPLSVLAAASAPAAADTDAGGPHAASGAELVRDSVLDERGLYFVSYDGIVNNNSFQQEGILTHGRFQYAAWYTADRTAVIARRPAGTPAAWQTVRLPHKLSADDSHNVIALGVSADDGRLHVAMDTHNSTVYYLRSQAGLADGRGPWKADSFGAVQRSFEGLDPGGITYPRFVPAPGGGLQLTYRTGGSGDGVLHLAEYTGRGWSRLGAWSSAEGEYSANGSTSGTRNMYLHGIGYDADGRLHASFTWRETAAGGDILCDPGGLANHDTGYVYSDDRGRTWRTDDGRPAAETGTDDRVSIDTPGHVVDPLDVDHALMNQESQAVDSAGDPHIMVSYVPGRFTQCVTDFVGQRERWARPFHIFRDGSGDWHKTELPERVAAFGRSRLVLGPDDDAYAVLPGGKILAATAASGWRDWRTVYDGSGIDSFGEVLVDDSRLDEGRLSVFYQEPSTGAAPSPVHVADFAVD